MKRFTNLLPRALRAAWATLLLTTLLVGTAHSHELSMAEMDVRQLSAEQFVWHWSAGGKQPAAQELTPRWPEGCRAVEQTLSCGAAGLAGSLSIDGVGQRYSAALVKVTWLDGQSRVYTLTSGQPKVQLYGAADDRRGMGEIAWAYGVLGIEHILSGVDHLAFVIALLFLVGFHQRLFWTITAFTAAHSLTLALSTLGWLVLRPPPVEATIALSIMLVAGEALHQRQTWSRRWPAAVAFLFGLVHGLGFAGALKEIGLPDNHLAVALLCFNLGVEAGQLLVVALAFAAYKGLAPLAHLQKARACALYALGAVAAYWSIGRVAALLA
jgi:hydrogenase/urease accessory protein HupE